MSLFGKWMHRRERQLTLADTNRRVFPFDWGLEWIEEPPSNGDSLRVFKDRAQKFLQDTHSYFDVAPAADWELSRNSLRFPTPTPTLHHYNNTTVAQLFPAENRERAVVVVPQWNADPQGHVSLCQMLRRLGITALRLSLPYHDDRRPPGMQRADYMVSPNVGRTLHATRQAVLEVRQLVRWLYEQGYERVGVMGTSIGSCVTYLAFVHDPTIRTGAFNLVSSFYADVVWTGLATRYVRWGLQEHIELDDLRECWGPVSPANIIHHLAGTDRPHLLLTAKYDLTFLPELAQPVFDGYETHDIPYSHRWLPCGHYTTAHFPFSYIDGWHICSFLYRNL